MEIWLPYGDTEVRVGIRTESLVGLAEPKAMDPLKDLPQELAKAIENPIGAKPLGELVDREDRVVLFIDLPTNSSSFNITNSILFELCKVVSDENITLMWRHAHADAQSKVHIDDIGGRKVRTVDLGNSSAKVPTEVTIGRKTVQIDSEFANTSFKILVSRLSFDPILGRTGCKSSLLGLIDEESRTEIYRRLVQTSIEKDPSAAAEAIKTLDSLASSLGRSFAVEALTSMNGEVGRLSSGAPNELQAASQDLLDEFYKIGLEKRSDILIVSAGGRPHDYTLHSSLDSILLNRDAVKHEGAVILVAECIGGYGEDSFRKWISKGEDLKNMRSLLKKEFEVGSERAYFLRELHEGLRVYLVSVMPDYYAKNIFKLRTSRTVDNALESAQRALGKDSSISVAPCGSLTRTHLQPRE